MLHYYYFSHFLSLGPGPGLFFPHIRLIPNDYCTIVFVRVVFVLFACFLCPRCSFVLYRFFSSSLLFPKFLPRLRPPVYHPDLFQFGNSGWSPPVTWPTPCWDKHYKHGKHHILCLFFFFFCMAFLFGVDPGLGVSFYWVCWSLLIAHVTTLVASISQWTLLCFLFGTLIIRLDGWDVRYWTTISGTTYNN